MIYLDSSALVRLVVSELETPALAGYLREHNKSVCVFSSVSRWEVVTAVQHVGRQAITRAIRLLDNTNLVEIQASGSVLREAEKLIGEITWVMAVHLASVISLRPSITAVASYDPPLLASVQLNGIPVVAPR